MCPSDTRAKRERLDTVLVAKALFESRERAQGAIMAGTVLVDGLLADKPGAQVRPDCSVTLKGNPLPYVSRGGLKLEKALADFSLDVAGVIAVDVGASTGGFTDCLLQRGATRVYAIDVGRGQLAWSLRNDPRVISLEHTNIRYLDFALVPDKADLVTVDMAFISVTLFSRVLSGLLKPGGVLVLLVKPQFEAGASKVGKKGVVRNPTVHRDVVFSVLRHFASEGFSIDGLTYSPIRGPEGNIEFLALLTWSGQQDPCPGPDVQQIEDLVTSAHSRFGLR